MLHLAVVTFALLWAWTAWGNRTGWPLWWFFVLVPLAALSGVLWALIDYALWLLAERRREQLRRRERRAGWPR